MKITRGLYWTMKVIVIAALWSAAVAGGAVGAYAGESCEGSGGAEVSGNSLSDDEAPQIDTTLSGNTVRIFASDAGTGIALIQADNAAVGVRKTLYQAEGMQEACLPESGEAKLKITANGTYRIYAYDGAGNVSAENLKVHDITGDDISRYRSEAEDNMASHRDEDRLSSEGDKSEPVYDEPARYGGDGTGDYTGGVISDGNYSWKSTSPDRVIKDAGSYSDWGMLRKKDISVPDRVWSEGALAGYVSLISGGEEDADLLKEVYVLGMRKPSIFTEDNERIGEMIIEGGAAEQTAEKGAADADGRKRSIIVAAVIFALLTAAALSIFAFRCGKVGIIKGSRRR